MIMLAWLPSIDFWTSLLPLTFRPASVMRRKIDDSDDDMEADIDSVLREEARRWVTVFRLRFAFVNLASDDTDPNLSSLLLLLSQSLFCPGPNSARQAREEDLREEQLEKDRERAKKRRLGK